MNYLFLSPYAAIHDWRFSEKILQDTLSQNSNVKIIGCRGAMQDSCIAIKAHTNFYKKKKFIKNICKRCQWSQKKYSKNYEIFWIDDFLETNDYLKVNDIAKNISNVNFLKFTFEKLPLGKISLFENMLIFKKNRLNFLKSEFQIILNTIKILMLFLKAAQKIYKIYKPNIVISQNGNYSLSKTFNLFFNARRIPAYSWEASNHYYKRFEKLFICKNDNNFGLNQIKKFFSINYNNQSNTEDNLKSVNSHFNTIINAKALRSFAKPYSKLDKSLRSFYNIKTKKIVLLNTSSWDEIVGTYLLRGINIKDLLIFNSQEEWIAKTIGHFKKKEDCTLLIRPHPRDYNNKNSNLMRYLKKINNNKNIIINIPSDKISLYTILKDIDLVLNSWSTLGMESGIFNIPTLSISHELILYPKKLECEIINSVNYFKIIDKILNEDSSKFNFERCKNFYNYMIEYLDKSSLELNYKRNNFLYLLSKMIDKFLFFFSEKSFQYYFNGFSQNYEKNNIKLQRFFKNKNFILNENIEDNSLPLNDNDYLKYYFNLMKSICSLKENSIVSKKLNFLNNLKSFK